MMAKAKLVAAACLTLSLITAGCGGAPGDKATTNEGTPSGAGESQIELRMTWWGSQTRHELTTRALELFESKHPGIKIKAEYSGWDGYFDKLSTQVAGSNAPDLIQMDYAFLTDYAKRGALLDLTPYTTNGGLATTDIDPSMIAAGSIEDKLYAVALGVNAPGVVYNSTVFKELGIPDPGPDWTWDEFSAIAAKIGQEKGDGFVGMADNSGVFNIFEIMVRQHGHAMFEDGGLGATKEELTDWFTMWKELRPVQGITSPEATASLTNALETRPLAVGTAAMDFLWSNQITAFKNGMKNQDDDIRIQVIPHGKDEAKSGEYLKPSLFISGYGKTEHPDEVAMVIDFLVNDPEAAKILGSERGVPVNAKIRETLTDTLSETEKMIFGFIDTVSADASPIDPPYPQGFSEIDKSFKTLSEQIAFEQGTMEAAIDEFIAGANQILGKTK
ncbi:hypothetical protein PA598K_00097 [Paenibacillus sp. 598K]|nr:hypothetical protein PA598K_00097 [Paenibacillus sp. 598K]